MLIKLKTSLLKNEELSISFIWTKVEERVSGGLNYSQSVPIDFNELLRELNKAKLKLMLEEEAEWMDYFNQQKAKVQELQNEVDRLDGEIDRMIYGLYGLREEEIKIVENN